jgi:hypothetical protein
VAVALASSDDGDNMRPVVHSWFWRLLRGIAPGYATEHDMLRTARNVLIPPGLTAADLTSYEGEWFGFDGIEMHDAEQLARLSEWASLEELFDHLRRDPGINTRALGRGFIQNLWYPTPHAETYAAVIRQTRLGLILEVGGGYSTLIARATLDFLARSDTRLTVVDPRPRTDVEAAADSVTYERIETLGLDRIPLEDPVLLFIDSSHVTRTGGDVPYLFTKLIPNLRAGSVVHVHDIVIPFDYGTLYQSRFYTEQYLLHALLIGSTRFRVIFASAYMGHRYPEEMRQAFGTTVPPERLAGSSFWFEIMPHQ